MKLCVRVKIQTCTSVINVPKKIIDMENKLPWADENDKEKEKLSETHTNNRQWSISGTHLHLLSMTNVPQLLVTPSMLYCVQWRGKKGGLRVEKWGWSCCMWKHMRWGMWRNWRVRTSPSHHQTFSTIHIYSRYIGQFVARIPVRVEHILSA